MPELEHLLELSMSATQAVLLQMQEDYPKSSIQWMAEYQWQWPHAVPLDQIDYSNKNSWAAQSDKKKIAVFKKKITKGVLKPAILVRPLHSKKYVVVDGHHRALTALELGRPLMAWTVDVNSVHGPWDEMHDSQKHGSSIRASQEDLNLVLLAADSLQKASTPEPVGPNPLWHKHGPQWHLPYYIQHVANALIENGHSESGAIQMAIGVVRRWASGGGHVDKNTRAAASKAISEWEHLKSAAHAKMSAESGDLFLSALDVVKTPHSVLDDLMLKLDNTDSYSDDDAEPDEDADNDDMQQAGVSMNAVGMATFGSVHIGHVRPAPGGNGHRGIHPSGRKTSPKPTRAKAALALLALHHRIRLENKNV